MKLAYRVIFHPVGQGLFTTGTIFTGRETAFNYVYDCGTSSARRLLKDALGTIPTRVNLVAISHFDQDHVNGLLGLLERRRVDVLLLPALTLEQRLMLAFTEGVPPNALLMGFFVEPTAFLASLPDADIGHIVFVPPATRDSVSGNDSPPPDDTLPGLAADLEKGVSDHEAEHSDTPFQVHSLKAGGRLVAENAFEFVPYNDAYVHERSDPAFVRWVRKESATLLKRTASATDRVSALDRIRDKYDERFGRTGMARNVISLFMYAGPSSGAICCTEACQLHAGATRHVHSAHSPIVRASILYTGDGYLNNRTRLMKLSKYLGSSRIQRVACLQVMHHGASASWHPGVAASLQPTFSVFSSDPNTKNLGHPHAEVVRDFLPYCPLQVDRKREVRFWVNYCCARLWRTANDEEYRESLEEGA